MDLSEVCRYQPTDLTLKYCIRMSSSVRSGVCPDRVSLPQRNEDNSRRRIWYYDNLRGHNVADRNTAYTDRIEMTKDQQSFLLTIEDVQLSDEREFYCQVNGLEARTSLRVFGEKDRKLFKRKTRQ